MLSSNSSCCNPNYTENDITSLTSKSQDPNFFFNFPTFPHMHLEYEDVVYLDHFLAADDWSGNNMALDGVSLAAEHQPSAARRNLKKDRHSKINTARGPRDRRMRLSLDIARRFFDLQDLLGYDKASRTVDWLLKNSRSAIRDLQRGSSRESCTSEDGGEAASSSITAAAAASSNRKVVGKRGVRVQDQQKRATVARESRSKARERARERTSQKRRLMRENTAQTHVSGESSTEGVLCQWNSFDFQNNINHEFLHQDEQKAEFQFNGKPWEGYNNFN